LEEQSAGIYELIPQHATTKRLDVGGYSTANGAALNIWDDTNRSNQRWRMEVQSDGSYEIIPQHATTKRLEVGGWGTANGAKVNIWEDANGSNQRWNLLRQ
jgi:hypothetical protein